MKKTVRGEVTVFLSLVFLLLLSLTGAVLESASIQVRKNERHADAVRAMESVFAEYQKELLESYHIFALDASYETGNMEEQNILNRLSFYGAENMDAGISGIRYLTDQNGKAFYEQAVQYMGYHSEESGTEQLAEEKSRWWEISENTKSYEKEAYKNELELKRVLNESGTEVSGEENPIETVSEIKAGKLLNLVLPDTMTLSQQKARAGMLVSSRERREGYGMAGESGPALSSVFFNLYLTSHFSCAVDGEETEGLRYELEYLLKGKESDVENLEEVVQTLALLRAVPNYTYLQGDSARKAEAQAAAAVLGTLLAVPQASELITQALLLAWSYGEALVDVRTLLSGKKVALTKSAETWTLSLAGLTALGAGGSIPEGKDAQNGFSYERYLQMLLLLEDRDILVMRALDMVELNLRSRDGLEFFRADNCVSAMEAEFTCSLRRGVEYRFSSRYGYR